MEGPPLLCNNDASRSYHCNAARRGKLKKLGGVAAAKHRLAINNSVPAPMSERHKLSGDGRGIGDTRSTENDAMRRTYPQMAISVSHSKFRWSHRSSHSHDGSCPVLYVYVVLTKSSFRQVLQNSMQREHSSHPWPGLHRPHQQSR